MNYKGLVPNDVLCIYKYDKSLKRLTSFSNNHIVIQFHCNLFNVVLFVLLIISTQHESRMLCKIAGKPQKFLGLLNKIKFLFQQNSNKKNMKKKISVANGCKSSLKMRLRDCNRWCPKFLN